MYVVTKLFFSSMKLTLAKKIAYTCKNNFLLVITIVLTHLTVFTQTQLLRSTQKDTVSRIPPTSVAYLKQIFPFDFRSGSITLLENGKNHKNMNECKLSAKKANMMRRNDYVIT